MRLASEGQSSRGHASQKYAFLTDVLRYAASTLASLQSSLSSSLQLQYADAHWEHESHLVTIDQ